MFVLLLETFHTPFPIDITAVMSIWLELRVKDQKKVKCIVGVSHSKEAIHGSFLHPGKASFKETKLRAA